MTEIITSRIKDWIYDEECYPNFFSCALENAETGNTELFEISEWKNDGVKLFEFIMTLSHFGCRLVGYNNIHYDYPLLHVLMVHKGLVNHLELKAKSDMIFNSGFANQNAHTVWADQRFIDQIDLLKIHHFDNESKRTSLKMLEFNMRSHNIKDLPYDPNLPVTREQADGLITYNKHDVSETKKFYNYSLPQIDFRTELTAKHKKDFMNHSDTKIGGDYFVMELNKAGIKTKGVKTKRDQIVVNDIILPIVKFESPAFNEALEFFKNQVITDKNEHGCLLLKGVFSHTATHNGFGFDFGAGGIHGSIKNSIVRESPSHKLIDVDVKSFYPWLAIANGFYPEHLSPEFCKVYLDVYDQRSSYDKGTPENEMLKLALNGVYGNSNSRHSVFYDPQYTLQVTVNGQLLLCMLAEQMMKITGLQMVQVNTDGITFLCPNEQVGFTEQIQKWWENLTGLQLEQAFYKAMYIRDVNSYIAEYDSGKLKRIGAYAHVRAAENAGTREVQWHKNNSSLVIAKAAEAKLVRGTDIREFITNHDDIFDFMMRTKVPRSSKLMMRANVTWGDSILGTQDYQLQNISRYHASIEGGELVKVMPHTQTQIKAWHTGDHYQHRVNGKYKVVKKGNKPPSGMFDLVEIHRKQPPREIAVESGVLVSDCSNMDDFKLENLNYEYYIKEAEKITENLLGS